MKSPFIKALWISVALHLVLLVGLFAGYSSPLPKPKPTPAKQAGEPIKAVMVDKAKYEQAINKIKRQKSQQADAEKKRIKAAEKRANDAKKRRVREAARIKKLENQRKKKAQEKIIADNAAKSAKAKAAKAEKVRKQKQQEKQAAEKAAATARSKRLKEEAAEKKAEQVRLEKERKRLDIAAKEQAMQDALLAEQMANEMASRNQARHQQVMTEVERYAALIKQSITQRMLSDRSTMAGKSCKLNITLAPSGFVIDVNVAQGDKVVCDAAKIAVGKAGNLPVSKDPEVFKEMRKLAVTVIPEF